MTAVKPARLPPLPEGADPHVVALTGRLLEVARQTLLHGDRGGLRPSHFRVLDAVPPEGVTITELARLLFMTKQGVGQFVGSLQGTGHLEVRVDPGDRRRRLVARTPLGDAVVEDVDRTVAAVEQHWRERVGVERYRVFRDVLVQLADAGDP